MKGFTCIEDKCNFKNDCQIIKHFYEKGRADREKELSELPNEYSEKLWKLAYNRGRADAIDDFVKELEFRFFDDGLWEAVTKDDVLEIQEKLKEQMKGVAE